VRGADESHEVHVAKKWSVGSALSGKHNQAKSAGAQQFVDGAQRVYASLGPHEKRTFFPECAGNGSRDINPRGTIAVRDCGGACGAHDGRRAAARLPHGEPAEWKSAAGECAVELSDARGDRIGGVLRDLNGVGKTLFKQESEGGN
jgi:hypothetical protein